MSNRDAKGRFLKGHNMPGPGRPALAAELPFKAGIEAACSAEIVAQVLEKLAQMALKGNVQAATLYLAYAVGKPAENTVMDRLDSLEELIKASLTQ